MTGRRQGNPRQGHRNLPAGNGGSNSSRRTPAERPGLDHRAQPRNQRGGGFNSPTHRNQRGGAPRHFLTSGERRPIGFRALEGLLEKDPEELVMELKNINRGFTELLQTKLTEDLIVLFIKILKKTIDCNFQDVTNKVLQQYLDDPFTEQLTTYILRLPMQNAQKKKGNTYFWTNPDEFWYNMIAICQYVYDVIPTHGRKVLPDILKGMSMCFPSFEDQHQCHISDEIKNMVKNLNKVIQDLVKKHEEEQKTEAKRKHANEEEPPDDFRSISVYPQSIELLGDYKVFLRENVVDGAYRDVDHYLDVQFRLLREDFVGPLRSGIKTHLYEKHKKIENVRIHRKVVFLRPETINEENCVRLSFENITKKKNFKYENSKRFMFGSLLCFTPDNFKTVFFGKIAERKLEDLQKGELIVGFDDKNIKKLEYKKFYLMVECGVYFEPYYHVLKALQSLTPHNFPMEKYIIRVDPSVQAPKYLVPGCTMEIRGQQFSPTHQWPLRNVYNLNEFQLAAFKAALTQEFVIIQGPPGTGKTYLGLKIARTLLENQRLWYKKSPMLVICYTNHALDQFLEGLIGFTSKIIRVGGQSKNEKLEGFNLRRQNRKRASPALIQEKIEVKRLLGRIQSTTEVLKLIEFYNSVRKFDVFEDVVPGFRGSWFAKVSNNDILDWLVGNQQNPPPAVVGKEHEIGAQVPESRNAPRSAKTVEDEESSDTDDESQEDNVVEIDDLFQGLTTTTSYPLITVSGLLKDIQDLETSLRALTSLEEPTFDQLLQEEKLTLQLMELIRRYEYINAKLTEAKERAGVPRVPPVFVDLNNPHVMLPEDRWNLYFYWLDLYKDRLRRTLVLLNNQFRDAFRVYEELRDIENTTIMKEALVVGMTTTGAARLRQSLQALRCPVVIVEEAAEVLEAHIIASLTKDCKHLILIGDHQQLKPSTANYQIERFFLLGISLFERMVLNKIQLFTLKVQHRMRPEISSLITPSIYPDLQDHATVQGRPNIRGVENCLFFIDHENREETCEGTSKKNYHEVSFLINFAKHLVLNGYKPEQVTILAAYLGQMFEMQKEKKKYPHLLEKVRIAVLDNYQGEESDIILLSLVRNNNENKIGFLSIENRVCVALSRAKNGFYLMGNMNQLCSQSELWKKIHRTLEQQDAVGKELALRCQVHRDRVTWVKSGEDFLQIPEGGCSQKCGAALLCGHTCTMSCHVQNRDHSDFKCRVTCMKKLCEEPLHVCQKMCYEECGPCTYLVPRTLACGHTVNVACHINPDDYKCEVLVLTTLPCGHEADKPCHRDPQTFRCPHPCEVQVESCGHACTRTCHFRDDPDHLQYNCRKKCARFAQGCTQQEDTHLCQKLCYEECDPCRIPTKKKRTDCTHWYDVACSADVDTAIPVCKKPCTKKLACGHKCNSECGLPCGTCQIKVEKLIPICRHIVKMKCSETPSRDQCKKNCPLRLPCGHNCTAKCNEPCTSHCKEIVDCDLIAACGHRVTKVRCWIASSEHRLNSKLLLKYCNHPCPATLKCNHRCSGTCGECRQDRIHTPCKQQCGFPLVCNHPCEFPCRESCRPCPRKCENRCPHSVCPKRCGDVCTPCKERCTRMCPHQRCTKPCSAICNVPPCTEPCPKRLKCGHRCAGFCGDPCPPKCLVCDVGELTSIFFGSEEEEGARFVVLRDCEHIFESTGLDEWMAQNEGEVAFKVCPRCKTPIKTTRRYSEFVKRALDDVAKAKKAFHGDKDEINLTRNLLLGKLSVLRVKWLNSSVHRVLVNLPLSDVFQSIAKRLRPERKGKRQPLNKSELNSIESKLQVLGHITTIICEKATVGTPLDFYTSQAKFLLKIVTRDQDNITGQEIDDLQYELNRLVRLIEYSEIKKFDARCASGKPKELVDEIEKLLFGVGRFNNEKEQRVMVLLKEVSQLVQTGLGISDKERREIVAAIDLKHGHWFKCRNGHVYAIGECGGAMQEAICPETGCGAKIGGSNHQRHADNPLATEMDGAKFDAWSQQANMANYEL